MNRRTPKVMNGDLNGSEVSGMLLQLVTCKGHSVDQKRVHSCQFIAMMDQNICYSQRRVEKRYSVGVNSRRLKNHMRQPLSSGSKSR